ncbi:hypothetical protein V8E54_006486 [Elaphomyces granulatus]
MTSQPPPYVGIGTEGSSGNTAFQDARIAALETRILSLENRPPTVTQWFFLQNDLAALSARVQALGKDVTLPSQLSCMTDVSVGVTPPATTDVYIEKEVINRFPLFMKEFSSAVAQAKVGGIWSEFYRMKYANIASLSLALRVGVRPSSNVSTVTLPKREYDKVVYWLGDFQAMVDAAMSAGGGTYTQVHADIARHFEAALSALLP